MKKKLQNEKISKSQSLFLQKQLEVMLFQWIWSINKQIHFKFDLSKFIGLGTKLALIISGLNEMHCIDFHVS